MYSHTYSKSVDQPGKVASPARGQLNRENEYFSVRVLCTTVFMLGYDWWLCMVIDISVQYNGGFLPGTILLTQGYYHWRTGLNTM